jgi:uncharacterized protein involved in tellurium resistance
MNESNKYYVYFHLRKDTGEVFYVGKGTDIICSNGRIKSRVKSKQYRNSYWHNIVKKHGYDYIIIDNNLSEEEAFNIEIYWIKRIGRKDKKLGTLVNMNDGGSGGNNNLGKKFGKQSQDHIRKRTQHRIGVNLNELSKQRMIETKRENGRKVMIDNVYYRSIQDYVELSGLKHNTIRYRLNSNNFNNYHYV